jgi:hypothetical protein
VQLNKKKTWCPAEPQDAAGEGHCRHGEPAAACTGPVIGEAPKTRPFQLQLKPSSSYFLHIRDS